MAVHTPHPHGELADTFRKFAEHQCADRSPLYHRLAHAVADSTDLLALAARTKPGQPAPNMLLGAIHHLVRGGAPHPLADWFRRRTAPEPLLAEVLLRDFCRRHAEKITQIISTRSVQTNEVNRCAVLLPALAELQGSLDDRPIRLVDIGASAGLTLLWDRYTYQYGGRELRLPRSNPDLVLTCEVRGPEMPPVGVDVDRFVPPLGVEVAPVDLADAEATEWLVSLTWPEQTQRRDSLLKALSVAAAAAPAVIADQAPECLARITAETALDQHLCFVFSWSIYQVFGSPGGHDRLASTLAELSRVRPISAISIGHFGHDVPRIVMSRYTDGAVTWSRVVALCDVYGGWINWLSDGTPGAAASQRIGTGSAS